MKEYLNRIKNKKVLVTGGLGFVGHNLVKTLVDSYQCEVIVIDDCSNSTTNVLDGYLKKIDFKNNSVLDIENVCDEISKVNIVFHLACVQIAASGSAPLHDLAVNAQSTLQMLEFIRRNNLPLLERFLYTSSCSVYGNSANNFPAREDGAVAPLSHYASTKLLGENYTMLYSSQYGVPTSVVRYSNVYGYGQSPNNPYCGVLGKFVHNALTHNPCTIIGDGEQTRDYTFITDAVNATILAAVHPKALGESFNIGTGKETSVNELVNIIQRQEIPVQVERIPERDIDNIRRRVVDSEKIHSKLGWAPEIDIQRGVAETLTWYADNLLANATK